MKFMDTIPFTGEWIQDFCKDLTEDQQSVKEIDRKPVPLSGKNFLEPIDTPCHLAMTEAFWEDLAIKNQMDETSICNLKAAKYDDAPVPTYSWDNIVVPDGDQS